VMLPSCRACVAVTDRGSDPSPETPMQRHGDNINGSLSSGGVEVVDCSTGNDKSSLGGPHAVVFWTGAPPANWGTDPHP
jgi:hypothetical protein